MFILICLAVLAIFFLAVTALDCNRFVLREYTSGGAGLKRDATLVLLSDLHGKAFGKGNKKLLSAIDSVHPDMVLVAGDMYTCAKDADTATPRELICALAEKYPVYYANGNHEHKTGVYPETYGGMYREFMEGIKKAGACHLVNEKVYLPAFNMDIYGLDLGQDHYKKFKAPFMEAGYLESLLGKPDAGRYCVLIAHNPDHFDAYAKWGADLVVSGHVHGGLMRLPLLGGVISPALKIFPKYDGGKFRSGKADMILSRGLGTHTLPVRIFNPGELVVIKLRSRLG